MSIYESSEIRINNKIFLLIVLAIAVSAAFQLRDYFLTETNIIIEKQPVYFPQTSQEEAIIGAVKTYSPAVVSIVISKDVPILEQYYNDFFGIQVRQKGVQKQQIGGGSGFIVSSDGMILTNKHVVSDKTADYTILTNDGKKFPAKVMALDETQDLAILKIDQEKIVNKDGSLTVQLFPTVKLGDSESLQIGQTVIAIGNALGEFQNTVSVGVISGLGRTITASGGGIVETLEGVIQTDAAINKGNSGGPLLNLKGEVIGINAAMSVEGENIGFAILINKAKKDINSVKAVGKIVYPFLGVSYTLSDKGASVSSIFSGSSAEKAGIKEGDIVLEVAGKKITKDNTLSKTLMEYSPSDKIILKILRGGKELSIEVVLGEKIE
ncbi:MAG: trypsin-like peptidase domain-containing protein [Patescibacteria group bacterium]